MSGDGSVKSRRSCGAALARLSGEAQESMKKANDGIWSRPVADEDLLRWESLVLGPALSPYAFGFFSFRVQFSEEYPSTAPDVRFLTTAGGKTRFNPNLYADGKVCLSILGTWRGDSGEQWSSVQNCQSVMVSIQSLMDDMPYHNEPGFEKENWEQVRSRGASATQLAEVMRIDDLSIQEAAYVTSAVMQITAKYNLKISHETLRIAVCDVLDEVLKPDSDRTNIFSDIIRWHFLLYYDRYIDTAQMHTDVTGAFENTEFEYARNAMAGTFDFKAIESRLVKIKEDLLEELNGWVRQGEIATSKGVHSYDCQQIQMALQKFERSDLPGISASPQASNIFVWDVTIMGGLDGGWWENGMYTLKLLFPQEYPDIHPRPKFETKMFHPNISQEGYPFLSLSIADSKNVSLILQDVHSLLKNPPNPDPRTWINKEAGELYFNQGEKGREEYARRVRRCASRSMED